MAKLFSIYNCVQENELCKKNEESNLSISFLPRDVQQKISPYLQKITYDEFLEIGKLYESEKCFHAPKTRKKKYEEYNSLYILKEREKKSMTQISKETNLSRATLYKRLKNEKSNQ